MISNSKPCTQCGATMQRKRHECGSMESPKQFANREYCSRKCYHAAAVGKKREYKPRVIPGCDEERFAMTFPEIAAVLGVSKSRVQQIYANAVAKVKTFAALEELAS